MLQELRKYSIETVYLKIYLHEIYSSVQGVCLQETMHRTNEVHPRLNQKILIYMACIYKTAEVWFSDLIMKLGQLAKKGRLESSVTLLYHYLRMLTVCAIVNIKNELNKILETV